MIPFLTAYAVSFILCAYYKNFDFALFGMLFFVIHEPKG